MNLLNFLLQIMKKTYIHQWFRSVLASIHKIRDCTISSLRPNQDYAIYATSSTIIGRSNFSSAITTKTLESAPNCLPLLTFDQLQTNAVSLVWAPSLNASKQNQTWIDCIGGDLRNFSVYISTVAHPSKASLIYSGLENSFVAQDLNVSTAYVFKVVMCNEAGCVSSEPLEVDTLDPPPNSWSSSTRPRFLIQIFN